MDGRPKRTRKSVKEVEQQPKESSDEKPSIVHPDDLEELEALASSPNTADLSHMADRLSGGSKSSVSEPKQIAMTDDQEKKVYRMDKKLIKESMSIAYSFVLTVAERGSKGVIPGNRMNDLIARKPGYQARLDSLLMAIAEEYGCDKVIPAPVALLLFTATVYGECTNEQPRQSTSTPSLDTKQTNDLLKS